MSWYYTYYLGIQDENGKIKPLGPYDCNGKLHEVVERSRSFETGLHDSFTEIPDEAWSDELFAEFSYKDRDNDSAHKYDYMSYCPIKELPSGSWIKSGYYLTDDIDQYMKSLDNPDEYYFEGFYERLSPEVYARRMENELKFGPPKPKKDCEGNEFETHSVSEYSYYCYPDYNCKEYDASTLRRTAEMLMESYDVPKGSRIVVILSEG